MKYLFLLPAFFLGLTANMQIVDSQAGSSTSDSSLTEMSIISDSIEQFFSDKYKISKAYAEGQLNPGFYRTYNEFIKNQPSIPWKEPYTYTKEFRVASAPKVQVHIIDIGPRATEAIGEVIGYCDGKQIYFTFGKAEESHHDQFTQVSFAGPFASHLAVNASPSIGITEGPTLRLLRQKTRVLNMEDGSYETVDKRQLKSLIQSDPELLEAFNSESKKESKIQEYLVRFVKRQN